MVIEIFQDVVCPWCRIGKKHLMDALEQFTDEPVEIRYRAFQLDPNTPTEGLPFQEMMQTKFRAGQDQLEGMFQQVTQAGRAAGLHFDFGKVGFMPNTLKAHQLIAIAPEAMKRELIDALFKAYFEDGQDVGNVDVLLDTAAALGMDREAAAASLKAKTGLEEVEDDLAFAQQVGVTGVPFFIINHKYALTGAQPTTTFLQALQQISQEKEA